MNEYDYRAAMAKQARIANLIQLRRLASDNAAVGAQIDRDALVRSIKYELDLR